MGVGRGIVDRYRMQMDGGQRDARTEWFESEIHMQQEKDR